MSETLVLDASVGLRIVLSAQPGHEDALAALEKALQNSWGVVAPDLYLCETGNVLSRAQGKAADKLRAVQDAHALVDTVPLSATALARAVDVASDGKLSFYDAAYLAIAEEVGGLLWTEDREILKRFPGRTADTKEMLRRLR